MLNSTALRERRPGGCSRPNDALRIGSHARSNGRRHRSVTRVKTARFMSMIGLPERCEGCAKHIFRIRSNQFNLTNGALAPNMGRSCKTYHERMRYSCPYVPLV